MKHLFAPLLLLWIMSSCIGYKQLLILDQGTAYQNDSTAAIRNLPEPVIQTDDRLYIKVSAFDDETAAPFNQQIPGFGGQQGQGGNAGAAMLQGGGQQGGNINAGILRHTIGYLVDDTGNIEFPVVGTIQLGGLPLNEAKKKMYAVLDEYLINYAVDIQFINRRVTVSGEILQPGLVELDRNRISVLEALQRAGGITPYSNTRNVTVIREVNGERLFGELNLKDRSIVNSQFYYVYPGDVIYVQPVRQKTFQVQTSVFQGINILTSILSAAALIIVLTR